MKKYIITAVLSIFSVLSLSAQSQSNPQVSKLYQDYIFIKTALTTDDADKTSKAAAEFVKTAAAIDPKVISSTHLSALKKNAGTISGTKSIDTQREAFLNLSKDMIALTKQFKLSGKPVFVMYCPMADGSWLSNEKQVVNPYYGSKMLSCGSVKSEIK
ncbi:DUF3347 domain-containing protein [Chryseobacterium sp. CKR4-1]|uniref:DUF3347 domain-containing protein n=1 Tax=Chryseobacterium sp. CKR4-1 TaxID=3068896 RepID=UPI0027969174|nr:DUF3347 domain-containing protein [Chryseobacterium sp. CKR4-1]MDQ1803729.1 DUF3347 domain-containing protein [Chryseobacterium sp. CKR4-1]